MENTQKGSVSLNFGLRGWLVMIYCFLAFVVGGAFLGVWQITITKGAEYGWNTTVLFSLMNVASIIMCLLQIGVSGLLMKSKVNIAKLSIWLMAIYGVAAVVMNLYSRKVVILSIMFIIAFIATNSQTMLTGVITGNWWPRRRGMVIGITTIGIPLGSAMGNGLYMLIEKAFGAENVFLVYAIMGFIIFAFGLLFVKEFPEECGEAPDNDRSVSRDELEAEYSEMREQCKHNPWNMRTLLSDGQVWLIIAMGLANMLANNILMMQAMNRLVIFGGMEMPKVLAMLTVAPLVACFGSPAIGVIDSKLGTKNASIFMCGLTAVIILLQVTGSYAAVFVGMALFGIEMGGASNIVVSLASDAFPRESSGRAFSLIMPVMQLLQTGVAQLALIAADKSQGYTGVYIGYLVLLIAVSLIFSRRYRPEKLHEKDEALWARVNANE